MASTTLRFASHEMMTRKKIASENHRLEVRNVTKIENFTLFASLPSFSESSKMS